MKKRLYLLFLFASGCCLSFLAVQPNKTGLLIMLTGTLLCCIFSVAYVKDSSVMLLSKSKKDSIISFCSALLIVVFVGSFGGGLPLKYADSGLVASLFEKNGINRSVGLSVISICMMAGAIPILFSFFEFLQNNGKHKDSVDDFFSSKSFFCLCFSLGMVLCVFLLISSFSYDSNVDDAFSLQLVKRGFARLTVLTAKDFHPPLYYYLLKNFLSLFSFTGINELFLGKMFSVVPYIILLVLSVIAYKKDKSKGASLGFTILLFASFYCSYSQVMVVRMYTWGLLFVTTAFFSARTLMKKSGGVITAWISLTVFALMSCYTQYFAAVAAVVIYGLLGFYFLIKQRKQLWKLIISGLTVVIGYAPWLRVFIRQITAVESDKNTIRVVNNTVSDYLSYFITQNCDYHINLFLILLFLTVFLLAVIVCAKSLSISPAEHCVITAFGAIIFISVILFGLSASIIGNPILLPRYLFMSLLPLLVSFGEVFSNGGKRIKKCASFILVFLIILQSAVFCTDSFKKAHETKEWRDVLVSGNDSVIYVESYAFEGRIIKQITGLQIKAFLENDYSEEQEKILKKYKDTTVELFDLVVYGDDYKLNESNHGDYLLNEVKTNGSALVVLKHPEITRDLEETGTVKAEKIGENGEFQLYRLSFINNRNGV